MKNFDNTVKRKNRILDQMLDDGVITKVDYDEAYQEEIKLNIQEVQKRDYIQTFVSYCAIRELMKKNGFEFKNSFADKEERETYETEYDDAYSTAQQMLLNKGYKIYTSFDLKKQKKLQKQSIIICPDLRIKRQTEPTKCRVRQYVSIIRPDVLLHWWADEARRRKDFP